MQRVKPKAEEYNMKISPEQIEALKLQQQQENKAKKVDGAAFGEFLNKEVQQGAAQQNSAASAPPVPGLQVIPSAAGAAGRSSSADRSGKRK